MTRGASRARDGVLRWNIAPPHAAPQPRPVAPSSPAPLQPLPPPPVAPSSPAPLQPLQPPPPPIARSPWPVYLPLPPPPQSIAGSPAPQQLPPLPLPPLLPPPVSAGSPSPQQLPPLPLLVTASEPRSAQQPQPPRQHQASARSPWPGHLPLLPSPPATAGSPSRQRTRPTVGSSWPAPPPPGTFVGAVLPVCSVEVLIVVVQPQVLADLHEANLYVVAFQERFRRTIVLVAQDSRGVPHFYGPIEIARVLSTLPFEVLPWRWLLYRTEPPPSWRLPIPKDADHADSQSSEACSPRTDHQLGQTRTLRGRRGQPSSQ